MYKSNRKDSLLNFEIRDFIETCNRFQLEKSIPILKNIVIDEQFSAHDRVEALTLIYNWKKEIDYVQEVFESARLRFKYLAEAMCNQVANEKLIEITYSFLKMTNKLLIENADIQALEWLTKELISHAHYVIRNPNRVGIFSPAVQRLGDHLGENLSKARSMNFKEKILEVLSLSLELVEKDARFYEYVSREIWHWIIDYFIQFKGNKDFMMESINDLRQISQNYLNSTSSREFKFQLDKIERQYLEEWSKPETMIKSISDYKKLKAKKYLDIETL